MRPWALWAVIGVLAAAVAAPAFSALSPPSGDEALVYVSVNPCAIFDTRFASAGGMESSEIRSFGIVGSGSFRTQGGSASGCGVPAFSKATPQAQAVLLNLVAITPTGGGNLKVWAGDDTEASGGVVNYQALSPSANNSNAVVVGLNQTTQGNDITVKVNGAAVHVRGVVLGYFVSGSQTFLTLDQYDPDRDGSVTDADSAGTAAVASFATLASSAITATSADIATNAVNALTVDGIASPNVISMILTAENAGRPPLDSADTVGWHTSIAIGSDNLPIISYYDATNVDLKVAHCLNSACTTLSPLSIIDTVGGQGTAIAIGGDNLPIIAYYNNSDDDLKIVHCTTIDCSSWDTPQTLDSAGDVGEFPSITIGSDGFPIVSYYDRTNADLKVVHCTNVICTTWNTPVATDTTGSVGYYTSIAIGTDDLPVISYYDITNGNLKLAHCMTATCSTVDTLTAIDETGIVGSYASMAIGGDGYPIISYYDSSNTRLKVVHCTSANCTTHDPPRSLDNSGDVGRSTSIAIGADGFPIIVYRDWTHKHLKAVHCTNISCNSADAAFALDTSPQSGGHSSIAIGADGVPIIAYAAGGLSDLRVARTAP